jgi:hypothetical protein
MKTSVTRSQNINGSALIVTLCICTVLGIFMAGYLKLVNTHSYAVARSDTWHSAIPVAEAGIEDAMSHLNAPGVTTNTLAQNSWMMVGLGKFQNKTVIGNSYSTVTIKIGPAVTNQFPVIVAAATVPGPLLGPPVSRTVEVLTKPKPLIPTPGAMVVFSTLDFAGFGITTDSFDSSNTNLSTGGMYDPTKASDHGDVCTISSVANVLDVGNGKVKGKVRTGPEGQPAINAQGSVGDMNWVNSGKTGIQTDHFADDVNMELPTVSLPPNTTWMPPVPGNYIIDGKNYKYNLGSGSWTVSKLDGSLNVSGKAVLYVTSSIKIGSSMLIHIAPGASLTIYMGGASASIGGQGVVNETGLAQNFTYYGLPNNTQLDFSANAAFVGSIIAPNCFFSLGGGGKNTYDFIGQCVVGSAKMNGHYNFHFDEALRRIYAATGFMVAGWNEL